MTSYNLGCCSWWYKTALLYKTNFHGTEHEWKCIQYMCIPYSLHTIVFTVNIISMLSSVVQYVCICIYVWHVSMYFRCLMLLELRTLNQWPLHIAHFPFVSTWMKQPMSLLLDFNCYTVLGRLDLCDVHTLVIILHGSTRAVLHCLQVYRVTQWIPLIISHFVG